MMKGRYEHAMRKDEELIWFKKDGEHIAQILILLLLLHFLLLPLCLLILVLIPSLLVSRCSKTPLWCKLPMLWTLILL